jgi:Zn-dependent M16 (insulinase) family peptidase
MESWLKDFERQNPKSAILVQGRFDAPRRKTHRYDSGETEDAKSYITVNWMLDENTDPERSLGLSMLSHILIATPASPLRKALMDSGLGEDLTGVGFSEDYPRRSIRPG